MFSSRGSDSKYFSTQKKGEIHELRMELNSQNKEKVVKDAVKKVIAAMTLGKDVSSLFTDVIKRMQTNDIELKKLVYLYIINYARSQPDKAILVVNTFQKDSQDPNPLIRALAIRTMGCIRVERITQFLCDPLQACLKDKDPYVRKTAAVCVAKLHDVNAEMVEEQGLLDSLRDMIADSNHTVVANAVTALLEIGEATGKDVFHMNSDTLARLLTALNACTEWGQVSILECLAQYAPTAQEAEDIIERVSPRLKHANCAVSMAAVKVILAFLPVLDNNDLVQQLLKQKLPPPLITLLSDRRPEIQYVALRNMALLVQRYPAVLTAHVKHFFCKYNDPLYVKLEKLELMVALAADENVDKVLLELHEYACEADVDFVRRAVRAIGRCAIKLPRAADKCISVLLRLIERKVNYVVQEAVVVLKLVFRRFPNEYESIIATLCQHLEALDEPEAKAAMIWIVGEYCERIENAAELLGGWLEGFLEEPVTVQLQLLTAVVKLFLKVPADGKDLVTRALTLATKNVDNPDLRDRGFIYWRLLSEDPDAALKVVLAPKPQLDAAAAALDPAVLQVLLDNLSSLAAVYHRAPESFVRAPVTGASSGAAEEEEEPEHVEEDSQAMEQAHASAAAAATSGTAPMELDLLGLSISPAPATAAAATSAAAAAPATDIFDIFGLGAAPAAAAPAVASLPILASAEKACGVEVRGRVVAGPQLELVLRNTSSTDYTTIPVKFNANYLNLAPRGALAVALPAGATASATLPLQYSQPSLLPGKPASGVVQVALKLAQVAYLAIDVDYVALFSGDGLLDKAAWLAQWQALGDDFQVRVPAFRSTQHSEQQAVAALRGLSAQHLATRDIAGSGKHLFFAARWHAAHVLVEVVLGDAMAINVKAEDIEVASAASKAIHHALQ